MNTPIHCVNSNTKQITWVAIDIAKVTNYVLIEFPNGTRKRLKVVNKKSDYEQFSDYLLSLELNCIIAFEATGNYHRTIAYYLQSKGFELRLISSLASARTREAMYNSWDKNDPKDAQVILHLLKTGVTQIYHDPSINQGNDIQELSKTLEQISLRKVRVQHSIMTHYLPLYFPEAQRYFHSSRARWFSSLLLAFTNPAVITKYSEDEFIAAAWNVSGRKVNKRNWLKDFYNTAKNSIGIAALEDSQAVKMFRIVLQEHLDLCVCCAKLLRIMPMIF